MQKLLIGKDYTVKYHARARCVKLRISSRDGLVVTAPKGVSYKKIESAIEQKMPWIESHEETLDEWRREEGNVSLPDVIEFRSIGKVLPVILRPVTSPRIICKETDEGLILSGPMLALLNEESAEIGCAGVHKDSLDEVRNQCRRALLKWLAKYAAAVLSSWLERKSVETGLVYSKVSVRNQRTRWGSCSAAGAINLNRKLLFLPAELVDYIIIHELCHTQHMNHSADFWRYVAKFDADYKRKDKLVSKSAWQDYVPRWCDV